MWYQKLHCAKSKKEHPQSTSKFKIFLGGEIQNFKSTTTILGWIQDNPDSFIQIHPEML